MIEPGDIAALDFGTRVTIAKWLTERAAHTIGNGEGLFIEQRRQAADTLVCVAVDLIIPLSEDTTIKTARSVQEAITEGRTLHEIFAAANPEGNE